MPIVQEKRTDAPSPAKRETDYGAEYVEVAPEPVEPVSEVTETVKKGRKPGKKPKKSV